MRRSDREITDLGEILSIINDCKVIHLSLYLDGRRWRAVSSAAEFRLCL